jgi:hypothetical protein
VALVGASRGPRVVGGGGDAPFAASQWERLVAEWELLPSADGAGMDEGGDAGAVEEAEDAAQAVPRP